MHVRNGGFGVLGIGKRRIAVAKGDVPLAAVVFQLLGGGLGGELGQRHFMRLPQVGLLFLHLLLLEGQHVIVNLLGVGRCAEDFQRIVLQCLDPGTDIGGVLFGIVPDAQLVAHDHRGNLGAQLFLGVTLRPEGMGKVAVEARRVASPVPQLMQRGRIVAVGALELALFWKGDAVGRWPIESPIPGAVADSGPGRLQDVFGPLHGIPLLFGLRFDLLRGQAVDLFGVEHGSEENAGSFELDGLLDLLAVRIAYRPALVIELVLLFAELPVLNRRAFLALAHLCAGGPRLLVGHPARIIAALGHQVNGVDSLIAFAGGGVHRHQRVGFAWLPRFLPRCGAGLELFDQLFGHHFMKRLLRFHSVVPSE